MGKPQISPSVYCILNTITSDKYIGSTIDLRNRIWSHKSMLRRNSHHSKNLQNAWNEYGNDNFIFKLLEYVPDIKDLVEREQWWMDNEKPKYNMAINAGKATMLGRKHSDDTRIKLSKKRKWVATHRPFSDEHRAALSKALTGKKRPKELIEKIGKIIKSQYASGERVAWCKGKKLSAEHVEKMVKTRRGVAHTAEHRQKITDTIRIRGYDYGRIKVNKLSIDSVLLESYSSITNAAIANNILTTSISNCISGRSKKAGGFKWECSS